MCLYPKLIKNPKYKPNKKNNYNPPPLWDERIISIPVGCQECIECRKQKARDWTVRLQEELRHTNDISFVTLTFSDESIQELSNDLKTNTEGYDRDNDIAKLGVHRFLERWRKKYKTSIKHWLVTELGQEGTENIHLHGFLWSKDAEELKTKWMYGFVYIGDYVNEKSINYMTKYVYKPDTLHMYYKPIVLCSPGIGSGYLNRSDARNNKFQGKQTREYYQTSSGHRLNLPTYYRNKIYDETEREMLWINKIEQKVRYVLGQKISIKEEEETYYANLELAQELNERVGFRTPNTNWDKKMYEIERRNVNYRHRKDRANKKNK